MAAPGDTQQTYPASVIGAGTAWPEAEPEPQAAAPAATGPRSRRADGPAGPAEPSPARPGTLRVITRDADDDRPDTSAEELERELCGRLVAPDATEVRLSAVPGSSARARRLIVSALETWGLGGHGEVAAQLVTELIANAVRHAGGRTFGLRLVRRQGFLRFEVRDPSRALPCLIIGDVGDEAGRGLQLVNALAQRWGADLMSHGKSVWFELRVREAV